MIHDIAILVLAVTFGVSVLIVSLAHAYKTLASLRRKGSSSQEDNEAEPLQRRLHELQNSRFSVMPTRSRVPANLIDSVLKKKEVENGSNS